MHWYKRNIGDYHKKAGRLTMLQHGAYTLLMDSCYDREKFPTMEEALEWLWASTPEEIQAVEFVLKRFFTEENGVFVQHRIKEELEDYAAKAENNKRIALEREAKRRESRTKQHEPCSTRTQDVNETPPNQEPITNNQEPELNKDPMVSDKPKPTWDFELCKKIWNEEKSISDCPSTGCNIVPAKLKSGLGKVHKAYQAYCKSADKTELERHEWFRAYAKGHLKRCESFVGKSDGYSWKPSIANLAEMKTFEALINQ